jgi:hypothetical protein
MAFHVGQKVCCVDDEPDAGREWSGAALKAGTVYTIRDFVSDHYPGENELCVRLVEVIRQYDGFGFRASRFRPVVERKTDISVLTALLEPKNHKRIREVVNG